MKADILEYFLRLSLIWGALWLYYQLFFRHNDNWRLKRRFILGAYLLGMVIPLIPSIGINSYPLEGSNFSINTIVVNSFSDVAPGLKATSSFAWLDFLFWTYWIICGVQALKLLGNAVEIWNLIRIGKPKPLGGFISVNHPNIQSPFATWNRIFLPLPIDEKLKSIAYHHEAAHLKHKHPQERLLFAVGQLFFWFHPLHWVFYKTMMQIQEYEADEAVLQHIEIKTYGHILIQQAVNSSSWRVGLFSSPLKNRIHMMTRTKKLKPWRGIQIFIFTCLIGALLLSCSNLGETPRIDTSRLPDQSQLDRQPFLLGGTPPNEEESFIDRNLLQNIYKNIFYPAALRMVGIQGYIRAKFVINEKGILEQMEISEVDQKEVVSSDVNVVVIGYSDAPAIGYGATSELKPLKNEVRRVLEELPDWNPGLLDGKPVATRLELIFKFGLEP